MMGKSILIIDDDSLVLKTLSNLFIKNGWNVDVCQNGEDGLEKIAKGNYLCILLDIRMPGLDGTGVLEKIRDLEIAGKVDRQNVIIMTGYSDESALVKVFQLGAWKYVSKPIDAVNLLDKINECEKAYDAQQALEVPPADETDEQSFKKIRKLYDRQSLEKKADILSRKLKVELRHIRGCTYDTNALKGNVENPLGIIQIPLGVIGPLQINGKHAQGKFHVPMATTEGALLLTYDLGARLLNMSGGVNVEVLSKVVHISPMFPIKSDEDVLIKKFVDQNYEKIKQVAEGGSRHATLLGIEQRRIKDSYVLKFKYDTADAHGLNMINQASFNACQYIESQTQCSFYLRSHFSGVKHFSLINFEQGYGRVVKASGIVCSKALDMLHVTAQQMKDFNDRCIECGTASGIRAVNVHASNGIAAIFLACGQDAADLSSAHTCTGTSEIEKNGKDLYWDCTLHNLLIGTVGGGTHLGTQRECLNLMDCLGNGKSDKLAEIIAAVVLAGEFPTAAAVVNRTYVDTHNKYGRNPTKPAL